MNKSFSSTHQNFLLEDILKWSGENPNLFIISIVFTPYNGVSITAVVEYRESLILSEADYWDGDGFQLG